MANTTNQIRGRITEWRKDGNEWVKDFFGNAIKLSNQQSEAFRELGRVVQAKVKNSLGKSLTEDEKRYAVLRGINIPSGMGLGKDFWAALVIIYFLVVFPEENGQSPHALATANTATQLNNVLWRQVAALLSMSKKTDPNDPSSKAILDEMFVCQKNKLYRRDKGGKTWFAEAVTIPPYANSDEQARALTGRHAPYMVMVLDEAAGLPEPVFTNLEGTLVGRVNLIIMIYNPIKARGYVADAADSKWWLTLRWNGEETFFDNPVIDNQLRTHREELLKTYGYESNAYRIRVRGLPPILGNDMFFPWDWVQNAMDNDIEPLPDDVVVMGVDPAAGGDNSVIVVRHGNRIIDIQRFNEPDTMRFLDKVVKAYHQYDPVAINIDNIGLGQSFFDRANQLNLPVYAVDYRRSASNKKLYKRVRDELWSEIRVRFEKGLIGIPSDKRLIDQLGSIKIKDYHGSGIISIPSKQQMKRDIGYSPDEADAICLSFAIPDEQLKLAGGDEYYEDEDYDEPFAGDPVTGY